MYNKNNGDLLNHNKIKHNILPDFGMIYNNHGAETSSLSMTVVEIFIARQKSPKVLHSNYVHIKNHNHIIKKEEMQRTTLIQATEQ